MKTVSDEEIERISVISRHFLSKGKLKPGFRHHFH